MIEPVTRNTIWIYQHNYKANGVDVARCEQKHRGLSLAHWCMKVHRMYQCFILVGCLNGVVVFQDVLRWVAER